MHLKYIYFFKSLFSNNILSSYKIYYFKKCITLGKILTHHSTFETK
jgi:hypothetical protein